MSAGTRLRSLFVGGPGRSGTSFVADRLATLPGIATFRGVELKFFTEKNGLLDLWLSLGESYSPNRAVVAMQQFRRFASALIDGQFGQPGLSRLMPAGEWHTLFDTFCQSLETHGHPGPATSAHFDAAARELVASLHALALAQPDARAGATVFLEKTPHALLATGFLSRIAPGAAFLHVMRDPRSIAQSLRSMPWGPDDLEQCCTWVDSYCRAWTRFRESAAAAAANLKCIHIEDVAAKPEPAGTEIGRWLGLDGAGDVFGRADPATLNGWSARCGTDDLALLTDRLAGWCARFGYAPDRVGCRPGAPSGAQATERAAPPVPEPGEKVAAGT